MVSFEFNSETGGQFYSLIFPFTNIILWYKKSRKNLFSYYTRICNARNLYNLILFDSAHYQLHFDADNYIDNDYFIK